MQARFVRFLLTWLIVLVYVVVSQGSLGFALSALIMDAKHNGRVPHWPIQKI